MAIYSYRLARGQTRWMFTIDLPPAVDGRRRQKNRKGFLRQEGALVAETEARKAYARADLAADAGVPQHIMKNRLGPLTRAAMAQTLHLLMTDVLGYQRYGAFGGDVGGVVTGWLGALYPEQVAGIHIIHPPFPASFDSHPLSPAEQAYLDAEAAYDQTDGGYSAIMGTRPDTISKGAGSYRPGSRCRLPHTSLEAMLLAHASVGVAVGLASWLHFRSVIVLATP